ncbi:hypothetical protein ABMA27_010129 [Loxostege sticticalis]|uniref:HAT C-terminal dimerisation domain-containing protein n=1 Tax=Loxostege sticticalis TaxID=481309 RepID=A0ABR3H4P4_LOXSC
MSLSKPYSQKFRREWLSEAAFQGWLKEVSDDKTKAYCSYCRCELNAKKNDLLNHISRQKHIKAAKPFSSRQQKLEFQPKPKYNETQSSNEASLSLFIAAHTSILPVDHLGILCKKEFKNEIKLHRTKCTAVIKNVLAPHFTSVLKHDIGDGPYSLLLDESTDISVTKLLGIVVQYFSKTSFEIVSSFLTLTELTKGDSESITVAVKKTLLAYGLDIKKLCGIGVDNASVMTGVHNGVYQKLKLDVPHLIMIKCSCHSIQLAVSHASAEHLPRHLEFLVQETYNWFSKSSNRQNEYRNLYLTINDEEPLKITQACATRWLSIEPAVKKILDQWIELKLHFQLTRNTEKCFSAETLYNLYQNPTNEAYLLYIHTVLDHLQSLVKIFQSNNIDPSKLLNDLIMAIESLGKRVLNPLRQIDIFEINNLEDYLVPHPYLGFKVENKLREITTTTGFSAEDEKQFRDKCVNFTIGLIKQLRQRLPDNYRILRKVNQLSVANTLKQVKENISPLVQEMGHEEEFINKVEIQWNNITLVPWEKKNNTIAFWSEVLLYKDAADINPFKELCSFALSMISLPWSNGEVERVFSQLNIVKNRSRNRLGNDTTNAILTIRSGLRRLKTCCNKYELPNDVLKKIGTMATYENVGANEEEPSTSGTALVNLINDCSDDDD